MGTELLSCRPGRGIELRASASTATVFRAWLGPRPPGALQLTLALARELCQAQR